MKRKSLALFLVITLLCTQLSSVVFAVNDEYADDKVMDVVAENTEEYAENQEKIETIDEKLNETINENTEIESEEEQQEEVQNDKQEIAEEKNEQGTIEEVDEDLGLDENVGLNLEQNLTNNMRILSSPMNETNEEFSIYTTVQDNIIKPYIKDGIYYLFIPKSGNLSGMEINYTGNIGSMQYASFNTETKKISGDFKNDSQIIITLKNGETKIVKIMQSDVPALFVDLDNDITLETVNSGSKDTKYTGTINVIGCDDNKNNISQTIELKGRGNTSWKMAKKGYQIKLNKKTNFLGIGNAKVKKWVLIANYQDPTLLKNKIMNDLCVGAGLAKCPNCEYADLYVNGNYIGNYLVCDKIEIDENRVDLTDNKGLIMELDNAYYEEEDYRFVSSKGKHFVVKEAVADGNDAVTKEAMNSFKRSIDEFEQELYSSNPSWDRISKMIDVESFAKYYLINEFAENTDSYFSSCYFYKNGENDVIHIGPTWDYDAAFGYNVLVSNAQADYTLRSAGENYMARLYIFPQFSCKVNEVYESSVKSSLEKINIGTMAKTFEKSAKINTVVWSNSSSYSAKLDKLDSFVENRKKYYSKRYSNAQVEYSTHIENIGWVQSKNIGISGTEGHNLRLEALRLKVGEGIGNNVSVSYRAHVQDVGWQEWVSDGELAGTTGAALRVEAVQIKLNNTSKYSIRYRVHIQDYGWTGWISDGQIAGTVGESKRIEAIEVKIEEKRVMYSSHVEDYGWETMLSKINGETSGVTGQSKRLEAIAIQLGYLAEKNVNIKYQVHVQDYGWMDWKKNGQIAGTVGEAKRVEAIIIKLENSSKYTVKYRVHLQDIGWTGWLSEGEVAGTIGQCRRIEAIEIKIVEK